MLTGGRGLTPSQQIHRFLEAVETTGSFISPSLCLQKDDRRKEGRRDGGSVTPR